MRTGMRVLARVLVGRTVATQGHAAFLTGAKMNPNVANFHAFGAFLDFGLLHGIDRIQVRAGTIIHFGYYCLK